jgi:hypothetical protein
MSCPVLSFSKTYTKLGSSGLSITIDVPEVYSCTNIQLRFRSQTSTIQDWFDYAVLSSLSTTINFAVPPSVCFVDVRLIQCCPEPPPLCPYPQVYDESTGKCVTPPVPPGDGGGGGGPPPNPDDPPCALIAVSDEEECSIPVSIINPYIKPGDENIAQEYNDISVPKRVNLTITQNSCDDISALLCHVRCATPVEPKGDCPCRFTPYVDVYSLPQLNIGRVPHGVPLDIDCLCSYEGGLRSRPKFSTPEYSKIEAYYQASYGFYAVPFIDGVAYDTTDLNTNTFVKIHTANDSEELRQWFIDHFRFFGINTDKTEIRNVWPYTDLYWHPYDFCIENQTFTPEPGVVYINIIPC